MGSRNVGAFAAVLCACGSGTAAKAVRDDVPKAETAVASAPCLVGQETQPWTFDMDNTTRGALFTAMQQGLVVVSFDCKQLKVLTRCDAAGNYTYGGYPVAFDVLDFKDSDELKASISGGALIAAKFEGEMKRGAKLYIAHGEVGMSTTTVPEISHDQIKGPKSCADATHYVTEVHFGAYQMKASSDADVKAAGDIFGRGGSGASASSADSTHRSGDPKACEKSTYKDGAAPDGCNTVVRVTLAPILPAGEKVATAPTRIEQPRPPPACPPGTERVANVCRRATGAPPPHGRACRPGDADDCARQCDAGDAASCAIAGAIYEHGTGVKPSAQTAFKYYKQACAAHNLDGCTGQASLYSKGTGGIQADGKKAEQMFSEACIKGNGRACSGLGQRMRLRDDVASALPMFERGCTLGYARACFYHASFGLQAGLAQPAAFKSFERACLGRDLRGCLGAATVANAADPAIQSKATGYRDVGLTGLERACKANDGEACSALGDYYAGRYDTAIRDQTKSKLYYETACRAGQAEACKAPASPSPPPRRPPPPPPRRAP